MKSDKQWSMLSGRKNVTSITWSEYKKKWTVWLYAEWMWTICVVSYHDVPLVLPTTYDGIQVHFDRQIVFILNTEWRLHRLQAECNYSVYRTCNYNLLQQHRDWQCRAVVHISWDVHPSSAVNTKHQTADSSQVSDALHPCWSECYRYKHNT